MSASQTSRSGGESTRERLLDAGEQLFSERGFEGTSVRELGALARCNPAAVNYYFGGKENLYVEVWRRHLVDMRQRRVESIRRVIFESGSQPVLEELLRAFAQAFVGPLVAEERGQRLVKLMAREMIDARLPPGMFGENVIKPTLAAMQEGLEKACPGLPGWRVPLVVFSLVGQLLHTIRIKGILHWIDKEAVAMFEPAKMIDHIVEFTAAGIRAFAKEKGE